MLFYLILAPTRPPQCEEHETTANSKAPGAAQIPSFNPLSHSSCEPAKTPRAAFYSALFCYDHLILLHNLVYSVMLSSQLAYTGSGHSKSERTS